MRSRREKWREALFRVKQTTESKYRRFSPGVQLFAGRLHLAAIWIQNAYWPCPLFHTNHRFPAERSCQKLKGRVLACVLWHATLSRVYDRQAETRMLKRAVEIEVRLPARVSDWPTQKPEGKTVLAELKSPVPNDATVQREGKVKCWVFCLWFTCFRKRLVFGFVILLCFAFWKS